MKERMVSLAFLLIFILGLSGCGTFEGAGKDVEHLGEEIQEEARD